MTIWKFETPFNDEFTLSMPKGAQILSVQQDQKTMIPCIWALVSPENEPEKRHFEVHGTGNPINSIVANLKFIGTYQYQNGSFVGHLFECV